MGQLGADGPVREVGVLPAAKSQSGLVLPTQDEYKVEPQNGELWLWSGQGAGEGHCGSQGSVFR